jgi:hypothetical protein
MSLPGRLLTFSAGGIATESQHPLNVSTSDVVFAIVELRRPRAGATYFHETPQFPDAIELELKTDVAGRLK